MRSQVFFSAAVVLGLTGCSGPYSTPAAAAKQQAKTVPVRLYDVVPQIIPETVTANGELVADDLATLSVKVPGRLATLNVDLGTRVKQGDVVAELEREDYEFRVRQAEAQIEQIRARLGLGSGASDAVKPADTAIVREASARLDEARDNYKRYIALVEQGVLSKLDQSRVTAALKVAEAQHQGALQEVYGLSAQLAERRAQLALARQQLQDTVVRAPFTGAITRRAATLGEYLAVNAPVAVLVRETPIRLRLSVPERHSGRIRMGQGMDVRFEAGRTRSGRVVRISPLIEAQNRSLLIEGEFSNEDGALRPGAFAEGVVVVNERAQGIAAPASAIVGFAGVDRVFVAAGGVLSERVVRPGRKLDGGRVEILEGLKPGERIVAEAADRLANGMNYTEAR